LRAALRAVWRDRTGRIGLLLVLLVVGFAVLGPPLIPWDPNRISIAERFAAPSARHWLGTDHLGRDMLARLADGGRVALAVSLATIGIALVAGTLLGVAAAFAPGWPGRLILVGFDVVSSFPGLLLALAVVALLGPGTDRVVGMIALTMVPHFGRVARAQALSLRESPFLEAERAMGASAMRVLGVHVLPNILGPLLVLASMDIPVVVTVEAGLSFLGVGVPPPRASWGALLNDGYNNLSRSVWPVLAAAGALSLATLGFTLFGEALRDAVDPRLRGPTA